MVVDPVCKMIVDPATADASVDFGGARTYFCSDACRRRFLANPGAYTLLPSLHQKDGEHASLRWDPAPLGIAAGAGLIASAILLSFYFGMLTLISGWAFTIRQFGEFWPFIVALAIGFGIQVGLFVYLRRAVHAAASGNVMVATGTTSGVAMVSCCTHYLVNLLPVLGATGLVSFVGQYQVALFWFGIASNVAGIAYVGRRVVLVAYGA